MSKWKKASCTSPDLRPRSFGYGKRISFRPLKEKSKNSAIEVLGRPAPKSATPFQEEPIILMMARPARSSTIIKPCFKTAVALESYTASVLRESHLLGPCAAFRL